MPYGGNSQRRWTLLNDTANSNAIELESDPEEIVELFFSQLKEEINNLMHAEEIDWEEAGLIMFDAMVAGELDSRVDDDEFDFQRFFEAGLDALLDLFLMADSPFCSDILNALQKRFIVDTSLAEDDAETRTGELLANVSKEILHSATETGMNRFEAARIYFEKLIHREETANQGVSSNLTTQTSPLFRDEHPDGTSPMLLPQRSDIDLDVDSFPRMSSIAVDCLELKDASSLYADEDTEAEETFTVEHLSGDDVLVKKEDEVTITTVAESLDDLSSCNSSNRKEFSIVVNGTCYTGTECMADNSLGDIVDNSSDMSGSEGESRKRELDQQRNLVSVQ